MLRGRFRTGAVLTALLLWLFFAAMYYFNLFDGVENALYDTLYQHTRPVDSRIVILGIDDASLARLGQWPWPRSVMAEAVDKLAEGGAAVVGFDIMFDAPGRIPGEDERLAESIEAADNVILPVMGQFRRKTTIPVDGLIHADSLARPIERLPQTRLAHVNAFTENDGVVRRAILGVACDGQVYPSLAYALYDAYQEHSGVGSLQLSVPVDGAGRYYISFTGTENWYRPVSFADLYEGNIPPKYFKDKIVLIGLYAQGVAQDWQLTAIDSAKSTYGVEIQANMLQQLLEDRFLRDLPKPAGYALFGLFTLAAAALFVWQKPRVGLLLLAVLLTVYGAVIYGMVRSGTVLRMSYAPAFCVLVYFAALVWHYTQTRTNETRVRRTFGKYMAPPVIKKILDEGEDSLRLCGQRRTVTVLFVDIRGFTPLSEAIQPEEIVQILNEYLDLMASCIHRHGGTLDKFIGDAAMAMWNAPYDMEGHTLAAVNAALDMRAESVVLEQKLLERYGQGVRFGIGIHMGDAIIGNIGASFRMDYTAIGDTVNTAARLESNAKPGQILLSLAAAESLKDRIPLTHIGGLKMKGKSEEVQVYEVNEGFRGL